MIIHQAGGSRVFAGAVFAPHFGGAQLVRDAPKTVHPFFWPYTRLGLVPLFHPISPIPQNGGGRGVLGDLVGFKGQMVGDVIGTIGEVQAAILNEGNDMISASTDVEETMRVDLGVAGGSRGMKMVVNTDRLKGVAQFLRDALGVGNGAVSLAPGNNATGRTGKYQFPRHYLG